MQPQKGHLLVGIFLLATVLANLAVLHFGPPSIIIVAFVLIGLDLSTRDAIHELWHHRHLFPKMAALVATGSLLTFLINRDAGQIALASMIAFAASLTVDAFIYQGAMKTNASRFNRMNLSNSGSALVDSLLFPTIAFGAFVPLLVLGQWIAKVGGGAVWAWLLTRQKTTQAQEA